MVKTAALGYMLPRLPVYDIHDILKRNIKPFPDGVRGFPRRVAVANGPNIISRKLGHVVRFPHSYRRDASTPLMPGRNCVARVIQRCPGVDVGWVVARPVIAAVADYTIWRDWAYKMFIGEPMNKDRSSSAMDFTVAVHPKPAPFPTLIRGAYGYTGEKPVHCGFPLPSTCMPADKSHWLSLDVAKSSHRRTSYWSGEAAPAFAEFHALIMRPNNG